MDLDLDEWSDLPPTPLALSPSPTQSHFDMVKSPWSEPGRGGPLDPLNYIQNARFNWDLSETTVPYSAGKHGPKSVGRAPPPHRKVRGESKKCRKVYGMDNRHMWCTQCRWKKACVRFVEKSWSSVTLLCLYISIFWQLDSFYFVIFRKALVDLEVGLQRIRRPVSILSGLLRLLEGRNKLIRLASLLQRGEIINIQRTLFVGHQ